MCFLFTFLFLVSEYLTSSVDINEKFYLKHGIEEIWLNFLKLYGQSCLVKFPGVILTLFFFLLTSYPSEKVQKSYPIGQLLVAALRSQILVSVNQSKKWITRINVFELLKQLPTSGHCLTQPVYEMRQKQSL